jgi:hypothetical protein
MALPWTVIRERPGSHVDELLGMAEGEGRCVADVTGVRARGGIPGRHRGGEGGIEMDPAQLPLPTP